MSKHIQERYINQDGILVTIFKPGPVRKVSMRSKHLARSESSIVRTTGKYK